VDYGAAHSKRFGHERYGKTFKGLYPEWGSEGTGGRRHVDFVAHSMGGQTVRLLLQLLVEGNPEEVEGRGHNNSAASLFTGGRLGWVRSITTVSSPHDGTTLFDLWPNGFVGVVADMVKGVAAAQGIFGNDLVFDFKLDQWGLERRPGEGFFAYQERVLNSSIWQDDVKDLSSYDLTVAGGTEMNGWTPAQPGVYYMSHAVDGTFKSPLSDHRVPDITMWLFLQPFALMMGKSAERKWWNSDGVVNTISENGPKLNSSDSIVEYEADKPLRPGLWNFMGTHTDFDHLEIIGNGVQAAYPIYKQIAMLLRKLPADIARSHEHHTRR